MKKKQIIALIAAVVVVAGAVTGGVVYHNHTKDTAKTETEELDKTDYSAMYKTAQEQLAEAILSDDERSAYTEDLLKYEKDSYTDKEKSSLKKLAEEISQKFDESEDILNDEIKTYSVTLPQDVTFADDFFAEQFSALGEVKSLMKEQKYQSAYNKFIGIETSVTAYLSEQGTEVVVAEESTDTKTAERKAALKKSATTSNAIASNATASASGNGNTAGTGNISNTGNTGMTGGNSSTSASGSNSSSGNGSSSMIPYTEEEFNNLRKQQEEMIKNGQTTYDPSGNSVTPDQYPTRAEVEAYIAAADAAYQQYCDSENAEIAAGHRPAGTFLMDEYTWSLSNTGYSQYGCYKSMLANGTVR